MYEFTQRMAVEDIYSVSLWTERNVLDQRVEVRVRWSATRPTKWKFQRIKWLLATYCCEPRLPNTILIFCCPFVPRFRFSYISGLVAPRDTVPQSCTQTMWIYELDEISRVEEHTVRTKHTHTHTHTRTHTHTDAHMNMNHWIWTTGIHILASRCHINVQNEHGNA